MFRKLVGSLSFSPALVGQLGFYAKRLRKEESTRRIGLIFTALALVVQSFAVFSPPESANAANPDAVIYESLANKQALIATYDRNRDTAGHTDLQQIYSQFGISRQDIVNAREGSFRTNDFGGKIQFVGRTDWGRAGRYQVPIANTNSVLWSGAWLAGVTTQRAVIGTRSLDGQWFAIMLDCGNPVYVTPPTPPPPPPKPSAACSALAITPINRTTFRFNASASAANGATISNYTYVVRDSTNKVIAEQAVPGSAATSSLQYTFPKDGSYRVEVTVTTSAGQVTGANCAKALTVSPEPRCPLNPDLVTSSPECKPCTDDNGLWYKDKACVPKFEISKKVQNITQNITDANNTTAKSSDTLEYTLTVKNIGKEVGKYDIKDDLTDILEYGDIADLGGGTIEKPAELGAAAHSTAVWPTVTLKPGESISKIVNIRVKATIPATATHSTARGSYDCKMTNVFGNTLDVSVTCPPEKVVEQTVSQLPQTGPTENMLFAGIVAVVVVYFYARSRQLKKEVRLIRRDLNSGTI